jgi:hypothetical protein
MDLIGGYKITTAIVFMQAVAVDGTKRPFFINLIAV